MRKVIERELMKYRNNCWKDGKLNREKVNEYDKQVNVLHRLGYPMYNHALQVNAYYKLLDEIERENESSGNNRTTRR